MAELEAEGSSRNEGSSAKVAKKSIQVNCESCMEAFEMEQLYKCTTCVDKLESTDAVAFNCEVCIVSHVRKGHDVFDHKSLRPAICEAHKNLCSVFCSTCGMILCMNCLSKHQNHNFVTIKERASQVRPQVFEILSDLDYHEKLVLATKNRINDNKKAPTDSAEKLVLDVSSEMDALKQKVVDLVKSEHGKTESLKKESIQNYENLLRCQGDLRELLSCSEGNLVGKFEKKEKDVNQVKNKQAKLNVHQISGSKYSMSERTAQLIAKFNEDFLPTIELPRVASQKEMDCYVYSEKCGSLYEVECRGNEITVYKCNFKAPEKYQFGSSIFARSLFGNSTYLPTVSDGVTMSKIKMAKKEYDAWISDMQAFVLTEFYFKTQSSSKILIKTRNTFHLFDAESSSIREIKFSQEPHHILFFVFWSNYKAEFVYWDELNSIVKQTNKQSIGYRCDSLPRLVSLRNYSTCVHFVNVENDIVEIETSLNSSSGVCVIKYNVHRVNDISCISHKGGTLIIWSLLTNNLTILHGTNENGRYTYSSSVPFGSNFNHFSVPRSVIDKNWSFLVKAKTPDEIGYGWADKNVFMIKDPQFE